MRFQNLAITKRFSGLLLLFSVIGLSLQSVVFLVSGYVGQRNLLWGQTESFSRALALNSAAPLLFDDRVSAQQVLAGVEAEREIESACLYNNHSGELFAAYSVAGFSCPKEFHPDWQSQLGWRRLFVVTPVIIDDEQLGSLWVYRQLGDLFRQLAVQVTLVVCTIFLGLLLVVLGSAYLRRIFVEPILALADTARSISETRDYSVRAHANAYDDEIRSLITDFNNMLTQTEAGQKALVNANRRLEDEIIERARTLEQLQAAQIQLIESEKMASLGGLVAGVAHEVNNPIGISVTAASQLQEEVSALSDSFRSGQLKKSVFEAKLGVAEELSEVILQHLQRAAELVASFKRVAVDSSADVAQRIDLAEYLRQVTNSLHPEIKKSPYELQLVADGQLFVSTYPGVVVQVVTNLVMNALKHAFNGRETGKIRIEMQQAENGGACVIVEDDGIGMNDDVQAKVFEPFFTTKRGEGGSGLGMHLVYNLVNHQLEGNIHLISRPGEGSRFEVKIPAEISSREP